MEAAETLVRQLLKYTESPPAWLREAILARGPEAVGPLLSLLGDEGLHGTEAPGEGWAPIHALDLLVRLREPRAIGPILELFRTTDFLSVLHEDARERLPEFGAAVVEPALAFLDETDDPEVRASVLAVLSECGVRDERIFSLLCEQLRDDEEAAAMNLATYGDARAVALLLEAFDAFVPTREPSVMANHALVELRAAIEELGGALTEAQERKLAEADRPAEVARAQFRSVLEARHRPQPPRRAERPDRNAPCWCGSGVKYKKCHLAEDEVRAHSP